MARNRKLELENIGSGRWQTSDGRFAILRRRVPIDPLGVGEKWKVKSEYSIHDFRDYDGPRNFIELAPEIGRVDSFREAFPWLGQFTGEGSFELGNPERTEAKPVGGSRKIQETRDFLCMIFEA